MAKARRNAIELSDLQMQVWDMRLAGKSPQMIARHLQVAPSYVYELIDRTLTTLRPPAEQVAEQRAISLERLDHLTEAVIRVLKTHHYVVSDGRVVELDGEPLTDDAPVLAAADRLLKIEERRARLLGLDMPVLAELEIKIKNEAEADIIELIKKADEAARKEA